MNWFSEKQQHSIHGDSVSVLIISWVQLSPTFFWECCYIREWAVTLVFSLENKIRSVRVNIFGYYLTRVSKNLKKHQPRGNVFKVLLQKKKKHIATLAPIELKQSQHNLITAVTHPVPNLPVLSHTRWSRLKSHSNFQREENLFASISNLRSRPCACWCVRLGCKRLANHRSKWMFTHFFYDHVHILIFFTWNGMNDGRAPAISSYVSCL